MPKKATCSASLHLALHAMLQVATSNFEGGSSGYCFLCYWNASTTKRIIKLHCRVKQQRNEKGKRVGGVKEARRGASVYVKLSVWRVIYIFMYVIFMYYPLISSHI